MRTQISAYTKKGLVGITTAAAGWLLALAITGLMVHSEAKELKPFTTKRDICFGRALQSSCSTVCGSQTFLDRITPKCLVKKRERESTEKYGRCLSRSLYLCTIWLYDTSKLGVHHRAKVPSIGKGGELKNKMAPSNLPGRTRFFLPFALPSFSEMKKRETFSFI